MGLQLQMKIWQEVRMKDTKGIGWVTKGEVKAQPEQSFTELAVPGALRMSNAWS